LDSGDPGPPCDATFHAEVYALASEAPKSMHLEWMVDVQEVGAGHHYSNSVGLLTSSCHRFNHLKLHESSRYFYFYFSKVRRLTRVLSASCSSIRYETLAQMLRFSGGRTRQTRGRVPTSDPSQTLTTATVTEIFTPPPGWKLCLSGLLHSYERHLFPSSSRSASA
jgi:hypothetical protein